jgi:hypothetical protein
MVRLSQVPSLRESSKGKPFVLINDPDKLTLEEVNALTHEQCATIYRHAPVGCALFCGGVLLDCAGWI